MTPTEKICKRCEKLCNISVFKYNKPYCYDCQKLFAREWKAQNRDRVAQYNKNYKINHKDEIHEYNTAYNVANRDKIQERSSANYLKRYHSDFSFKIAHNLRKNVRKLLKGKKHERCFDLLGCSKEFFLKWLEFCFDEYMTLENHGKIWHIDHVVPCSVFDLSKNEEVKKCFHWTNMKPMLAKENIQKNNKVCHQDIGRHEKNLEKFMKIMNTENYTIIPINRYSYAKIP